MSPIVMGQTARLILEEETFFPRSYRARKWVFQATDTVRMNYAVDVYANVAVVTSEIRGQPAEHRVVVPTGVPIVEVGSLFCWYELMFWVEKDKPDRQRIQWLDPTLPRLDGGEIRVAGSDTVMVLGKETPVTVYKAERERLGPATLWVDAGKRIVRCEQNATTYDLVDWSEERR
jgi:hypothetical protein